MHDRLTSSSWAGTAGLSALREVKKRTQSFAIINDGPWGTLCARVGCMPSKALIAAPTCSTLAGSSTSWGSPRRWPLGRRRGGAAPGARAPPTTSSQEPRGHSRARRSPISGRARLLAPDRVTSTQGAPRPAHHPRHRLLADRPARLASPGERLLTTDTLFEQLTLPVASRVGQAARRGAGSGAQPPRARGHRGGRSGPGGCLTDRASMQWPSSCCAASCRFTWATKPSSP